MKRKKSKKNVVESELPSNGNPELQFESSVTRNLVGIVPEENKPRKKKIVEPEEEYEGILSSSYSSKDF